MSSIDIDIDIISVSLPHTYHLSCCTEQEVPSCLVLSIQWWITSKKLYIGRGSITVLTRNATCGFRSEILGGNGWGQGGGKHSFVCKPTLFHFSNLNWNLKAEVWTNNRLQKMKIQSNEMEKDSLLLWWGSHSFDVFYRMRGTRIVFVEKVTLLRKVLRKRSKPKEVV